MALQASIVIPTYKRPAYALEALHSVLGQHTDCSYEVLFLDNGCDSGLENQVQRIAARNKVPTAYHRVEKIGLHSGRHTGARKAKGEVLIFIDDDVIVAPTWLNSIIEAFRDPSVHLAGGRYLPKYEAKATDWLPAFWDDHEFGHWCGYLSLLDLGDEVLEIDPTFVWGLGFAIRKDTLFELGGFHPDSVPWEFRRFRGDGETALSSKAREAGLKAIYHPGALLHHRVSAERLSVEYFEKRAFLQGISDSFTAIRANGGIVACSKARSTLNWKAPLRRARDLVKRTLRLAPPPPVEPYQEVKARVRAAYRAGYEYHQCEVRSDSELLKWVLKPDYWDGGIPVGVHGPSQSQGVRS